MGTYLVDLENVHNTGLEGMNTLSVLDDVYIFYSKNAPTIDIDKLIDCKAKLSFIKTEVGVTNALDFQLIAFLFKNLKKKHTYYIISKDNGYSAIVNMGKEYGANIVLKTCIGSKESKKFRSRFAGIFHVNKDDKAGASPKNPSPTPDYVYGEFYKIIKDCTGADAIEEMVNLTIDGISECPGKADFYKYCLRVLGEKNGHEYYTHLKKSYPKMKAIIELAA